MRAEFQDTPMCRQDMMKLIRVSCPSVISPQNNFSLSHGLLGQTNTRRTELMLSTTFVKNVSNIKTCETFFILFLIKATVLPINLKLSKDDRFRSKQGTETHYCGFRDHLGLVSQSLSLLWHRQDVAQTNEVIEFASFNSPSKHLFHQCLRMCVLVM